MPAMSSATQSTYSPYSNDEYTVGWICALPIEMAAAKGMMDEKYGDPQVAPQGADHNTYLLGCIGKFKVVVACLPKDEIGSSSAAAVAKDMLFTFPNVRVGLLVGIGAGIPDYEGNEIQDIRLGDVVISSGKESGGVVLYDFGKRLADGSFKSMGVLDRPPQSLRTAMSLLEAEHQTRENRIPQYINRMLAEYPYMRKKGFTHPGQAADQLFRADYRHVSGRSCEKCDPAAQIDRYPESRPDTNPAIHYGVIATGSAIVKHAPTRDEIGKKHRAICLEMEAAGLMNNFQCVVIRGISDYADSHKNDQWQPYAAATAAACAKELLEYVQPKALDGERTVKDILSQVNEKLREIKKDMSIMNGATVIEQMTNILDWLTPVNYGLQQSDFINRRQEGTGNWLLDSEKFQHWLHHSKRTLFCQGIPGSGKTIMASIVINHLDTLFKTDAGVGIAYLYCNFRQPYQRSDLLASLLKQLARRRSIIPESMQKLFEHHRDRQTRPSLDEIFSELQSIVAGYRRVFIIIDALDECQVADGGRTKFLTEILNLQAKTKANLFATSRIDPEIAKLFEQSVSLEIYARNEDVQRYLNGQMSQLPSFVQTSPGLQDEIKTAISKAVDGMFLLAQLHIDSLANQPTVGHTKQALQNLPKGLDQMYAQAMKRIESQGEGFRDLAKKVLSWVVHAKRTLSTGELQHAIAVERKKRVLNDDFIPSIEIVVSVCAGLVTFDIQSDVVRLIHYTTQEYFERTSWFPTAESDITTTCITYLSFSTFGSGFCHSAKELEERLQVNKLYEYAARNWGHHAQAASAEVGELILEFLESETKIAGSVQAMMTDTGRFRDGQLVPRQITGVHLAAHFGLGNMLIALIKNGRGTDLKDFWGRTPLSWAAENGHVAAVKLLLAADGVDPDSKDNSGRTPLSWAAENGQVLVVKLLLTSNRVDPDSKDDNGWTPLSRAAVDGHEAVVKLLLTYDRVDSDSKDYNGRTPLSRAAENGHEKVVKLLLAIKGVNPDSKDEDGSTPLSWAADNGHVAVVKLLLAADGVDPDSIDNNGWTPLLWAAGSGHEAVIKLLLAMDGVDPDSMDEDGSTPLSWAAENGHIPVVKLLLINDRVDPNSKDDNGWTPLLWAAENGHEVVVKLLLTDDRVNLNSKDYNGQTPLSRAAENGHEAVVKLLLTDDRVNPNSKDYSGRTPLSRAAENGHESVIKLLLAMNGVDLNSKDDGGRTPLSWAAESGHVAVVKVLLTTDRVDLHSRVEDGYTPLLRAAAKGHAAVVGVLKWHHILLP